MKELFHAIKESLLFTARTLWDVLAASLKRGHIFEAFYKVFNAIDLKT